MGKGDARVSTVEHGLSALYALGIDNCIIQVNGPEFPILDGSAIQYVNKIKEIGVEEDLTVIQVLVNDSDMGAVIGRNGNIIKSVRTLVQAAAYQSNKKVRIDIDSF